MAPFGTSGNLHYPLQYGSGQHVERAFGMTTAIVILIVIVALVALSLLWDWRRSGRIFRAPIPRPYRDRDSQEDVWRRRYDGKLDEADILLTMLCDAFLFNPDDRYKFGPDDQVMDIYRACYPRWKVWRVADDMEVESLMVDLDEEFGTDIADRLEDITLGQIVELAFGRQDQREGP